MWSSREGNHGIEGLEEIRLREGKGKREILEGGGTSCFFYFFEGIAEKGFRLVSIFQIVLSLFLLISGQD